MSKIYRNTDFPSPDFPRLDLLTLLFESPDCRAEDQTPLHCVAGTGASLINKRDLSDLTQRLAYALRHRYGIGSNGPDRDVVTVLSFGQPMVAAVLFGVIAAGGVYSAATPSSTTAELVRYLNICNSRLIMCSSEFKDVVMRAAKEFGLSSDRILVFESTPEWTVSPLNGSGSILTENRLHWETITDVSRLKESLIVILWSSGTTGFPKGVKLSHQNLVSETHLTSLPSREFAQQAAQKGIQMPPYRALAHLPISHIAGLFAYLIAPFYAGGQVFWMRKYEWHKMLQFVKQHEITLFYTVPSIYLRISKSPDVRDHFRSVVSAVTGAAPMDGELQKAASSRLGAGETVIGQTWGLSETTGAVTIMPPGKSDATGSISPLVPGVEIRLVDEDYRDVEPGQPGELLVRGPMVTNGYYNDPKATAAAFYKDWFCTGDIAVWRDGLFYIVDRKKEILKYKGQQVSPAELEALLITHPSIQEAAVIGIRDPSDPTSDLPRSYVVADPGEISADQVKAYVSKNLSASKQLRGGVVFVKELPKNAVGKILRRELRDQAGRESARPKL
ncbi:hypothetical protein AYO21_00628 [Fonsecaea monophora]|uniref:4-coumarate-CoA ligase n=1 Tax=Fonsecaea monophora TaxID=254056 RepID=A0A177FNW8_9EURO|nr:hypothetical protein AYO21_00628 [Fonsecaea monophora]KAH0840718.1 putative acyl-coenzyme A synthetase [Fonsecaea pedrosoi]OAG45280.1 hypothetical protein AYO21_00628 [Fonsecaea monophora]